MTEVMGSNHLFSTYPTSYRQFIELYGTENGHDEMQ